MAEPFGARNDLLRDGQVLASLAAAKHSSLPFAAITEDHLAVAASEALAHDAGSVGVLGIEGLEARVAAATTALVVARGILLEVAAAALEGRQLNIVASDQNIHGNRGFSIARAEIALSYNPGQHTSEFKYLKIDYIATALPPKIVHVKTHQESGQNSF